MEKVWEIKDPDEYFQTGKKRRITKALRALDGRDPARAYTLSLLFWGGGQSYNEQRGKGLLFQLLMIFFCMGALLSLFFLNDLLSWLHAHAISNADAFLSAELLLFCALLFWTYNAGDAYHTAANARRTPFTGIQSRAWPLVCSLLVPGWGQFLNGQAIKGSIFAGLSVLGIFSLLSIPAVLLAWPSLEVSEARFIIEAVFAVTALFAPLIPFIWLLGGFDALKVSLDDLKKEPLFDRIRSANNRRRTQGWVRGVFPHIRSTVLLVLFLAFLLIIMNRYYFPRNFYGDHLAGGRAWLQKQGMTLVPDLISRLLSVMALAGK